MGHPFRIREIAAQAGVSEATVDRVLNNRGGVRAGTAREVRQAITDLYRQQTQVRLGGRTLLIDLVMQAPARFSGAVRAALEAELPLLRPAVIRARFHLGESGPPGDLVATLDRVAARGSQGVILKAPDLPEIAAAARRLVRAGIPVVTLVTDVPHSQRLAYVGIDNLAAGATAAYLIGQWLREEPGNVLVTVSNSYFRGEEEREIGFRAAMRRTERDRAVFEVTGSDGLDEAQGDLVRAALGRDPGITAVYSIGGGNLATIGAFDDLGRRYRVFIAHDLDGDNTGLLRQGRLSAVLHHDLHQDVRRAAQALAQAHKMLPGAAHVWPSSIQVITPHNLPASALFDH